MKRLFNSKFITVLMLITFGLLIFYTVDIITNRASNLAYCTLLLVLSMLLNIVRNKLEIEELLDDAKVRNIIDEL